MPGVDSNALRCKLKNKDTGFTNAERQAHGLVARLPARVETLHDQIARCSAQYSILEKPIEKWLYLTRLQETNETLFSAFCLEHLKEVLPIVYTPTVGLACKTYSTVWQGLPRGFYLNRTHLGRVRSILDQWPHTPRIIVCTDGTRILGLGDLGTGGHQICVGKLTLYSLGGGFAPEQTLPISFDFGCDVPEIRDNQFYLGLREPRNKDADYYNLIAETISAVHNKWPDCVYQFEDFSNDTAFKLLEKHREDGPVFNDDIQGTGCIAAATLASAVRSCSIRMGRTVRASDQVYVMYGAGAGGIGVAESIARLSVDEGKTLDEARRQFYVVDSQGLITTDRSDYVNNKIASHKIPYARSDMSCEGMKTLLDVVKKVKPTCLLGLSTISKSFNEEVLTALCEGTSQDPIVFALSNPTEKCECTAEECMKYTKGRALYASGSPMPPVVLPDGKVIQTAQCNNFYVFPGIGLGAYACRAKKITEEMIGGVARALAAMVDEKALAKGELLPDISLIREVSCHCALGFIRVAETQNLVRKQLPTQDAEVLSMLRGMQWVPKYE